MTFNVTLSGTYNLPVTVNYATADGTATAGLDYTAVSDTLTFQPGESSKTITVMVTGDRALSEDLVQEAFVRVAAKLDNLRDPGAFPA